MWKKSVTGCFTVVARGEGGALPLPLKLRISNFKSIDDVELELAPLTVLIGPPASGKSNILDALALLGYLGRQLLLDDEYGGDPDRIEPVNMLARFASDQDMFRLQDLSKTVRIGVEFGASDTVEVELYYRQGTLKMKLNGVENPPYTHLLTEDSTFVEWVRKSLSSVKRFDVRVYGYERYGLSVRSCVNDVTCGFYRRLKGEYSRSTPVSVLSELAWNVTGIVKKVPRVVPEVNDVVRMYLGEKVELKVLRNGTIAVFDWDYEVDAAYLSDGILRSLYYLLALASSTNYAKLRGLENRLIVGLEEPESHVFPFMMGLLAEYILEAVKADVVVVVSTHNPLFASLLGDKVEKARFYYVFRGRDGSTSLSELDFQALAKEFKTIEDVMLMPVSEIVDKYVKELKR